jgi:hypothetical protein
LLVDVWSTLEVWLLVEVGLVIVLDWFAVTPLFTDWLPFPTCTPGLIFAPAFTALFEMFAFASTPTFGFTLSVLPEVLLPVPLVPVEMLDWPVDEPCVEFDVAPVLLEVWPAVTSLFTLWLPLPMFTPGLTFAPRFTSVLLMLAFASTPTFGFTFSVLPERPLPLEDVDGEDDDVEPLADMPLEELEPLSEPLVEEAEPLRPLPLCDVLPLRPAPEVPAVEPPDCVEPEIEPLVPLDPLAVEPVVVSSMQSLWTGLAECSFAAPVSLFASLPALGFL